MTANIIFDKLKAELGNGIIELVETPLSDPYIIVSADTILEACLVLRDEAHFLFDYMVNLSGVDQKDSFAVVYHLYSIKLNHRVVLKVILTDRENPTVPSVERVWKTANWHERETFDMFGINFEGHPNLIRILSPYDWEGFPLRKDYKTPDFYKGMKVPY